jgi:hypothetical protein
VDPHLVEPPVEEQLGVPIVVGHDDQGADVSGRPQGWSTIESGSAASKSCGEAAVKESMRPAS